MRNLRTVAVAILALSTTACLEAAGSITPLGPPSTEGGLVEEPRAGFCDAAQRAGQVNDALGNILNTITGGAGGVPPSPEQYRAGATQLATAKQLLVESYNALAAVSSPEIAADVLAARANNEQALDIVISATSLNDLTSKLPFQSAEEQRAAAAAVYRVDVMAKTKCGVSFVAIWGS